jgi:sporulation protein YlmC with PRC-barrel domain
MSTTHTSTPRVLSASTLAGDSVKNRQNEDLGKIEDFMLDLKGGRIAYCVLSFGGVLGLGNKLFAVPWSALALDTERHCFILNASKDKLKDAPGFDKNNWPDMADTGWSSSISGFYGTEPYSME